MALFHFLWFNNISLYVLPSWLSGKGPVCQAGDAGLIPVSGRSSGEGNGIPFQYSCVGNPMDYSPPGSSKESDTKECHKRVRHNLVTKQQQQYSTELPSWC